MRKNYFFGALVSLVLALFAIPANAQVSSIADLYGTYQFTADVTMTEGMEAYADQISGDCEVEISKDAIYDAQIVGFAGSTAAMKVNAISTEKEMIKVTNPNNPQLWDALYLANENGDYPYGVWDNTVGEWTVESYGPIYFSYDPTTKLISVPDFTIVTCDHQNSKATVVAKVTNAKLTLKQSTEVDVVDLSGEWHAKAGAGTYSCNHESTLPTEYDFVLTKTGEDNKNYTAELTIEGFKTVYIPATFDGVNLSLHADSVVLDEATAAIICYYDAVKYDITFSYVSETTLSMSKPLAISYPNKDAAEGEAKYDMEQWYMDGTAKRASDEGTTAFDWAGTWTVKATEAMANVPAEFEMEVTYYEEWDMYLITKFMGNDVAGLNQGGIMLTPSADGKTAEIKTGAYLQTIEAGVSYSVLYDMNIQTNPIVVTVNEDGTLSIANFSVATNGYGSPATDATLTAFYTEVTASKPATVEPAAFDWAGTWAVKAATVSSYDGNEYPAEFDMVVEYMAEWDMYLVTKFMGNDVANMNQGGILLTPSEDGMTAELKTGTLVGGSYPTYLKMYDMNATTSPLLITRTDDGTLTISNFYVKTLNYDTNEETAAVYYQGVTASKPGEVVEPVKPTWDGTWYVKAGKVDAYDGKEYPTEFEMEVAYMAEWDMYLVTKFMGNDIANMNQGGILLTPSEDGMTAELKTGTLVGGSYPDYLKIYDMNATTSPLQLTMNEDGTITIANFFVKSYNYDSQEEAAAVYYQNVTASKDAAEEEPKPEMPTWDGTWNVKADKVDAYDGKEYPTEFVMEVAYMAEWDMYLVTKFMGNDIANMNQGGILLTPSEDGMTAELKTGTLVGGSYPDYLKIYDMNATTSPLQLTMNEDGTITIANFFVKSYNYDSQAEAAAVYYQNVTATKGEANAIEDVKSEGVKVAVEGGVINIAGGAQPVQVYDAAGRLEFSGVASSVANLAKGLHIVKIGNTAAKVIVK